MLTQEPEVTSRRLDTERHEKHFKGTAGIQGTSIEYVFKSIGMPGLCDVGGSVLLG
jgi:hypothetical protein